MIPKECESPPSSTVTRKPIGLRESCKVIGWEQEECITPKIPYLG